MRILQVSHVCPYPPDSGGQQRSYLLWKALEQIGEVDHLVMENSHNRAQIATLAESSSGMRVAAVAQEPGLPKSRLPRMLKRLGLRGMAHALAYHSDAGRRFLGADPQLVKQVKNQVNPADYDLIVGRYLRAVTVCGLLDGTVPVAVDVDDFQPDLIKARLPFADPFTRITLKRQLMLLEQALPPLLAKCRQLWISKLEDQRHSPLQRALYLPNLPFSKGLGLPSVAPRSSDAANSIAVIGTWTYSANAHGLDVFLHSVWPKILHAVPHARLRVGGKLTEDQKRRWSAVRQVELLGYVEDLTDFYARTGFFIAPIFFGAGTNVKVLEGAAFGRSGVITAIAARGYENTLAGCGGLNVASDLAALEAACIAFLRDPATAVHAGERARVAVEAHFNWSIFLSSVSEGVRRALQ